MIFTPIWESLEEEVGREHLRFPKEIILLGGAPGAGKGTQTPFISREERDAHGWGWRSAFALFEHYLAQFTDDDWGPKGRPRSDGSGSPPQM